MKGETYTKVFQKEWDFSPTDYVLNAIFSKTPLFLAPLIKNIAKGTTDPRVEFCLPK